LSIHFNPAEFASAFRQDTSFEKSSRPEPSVDSYADHERSQYKRVDLIPALS
jgi:hypothetical protein